MVQACEVTDQMEPQKSATCSNNIAAHVLIQEQSISLRRRLYNHRMAWIESNLKDHPGEHSCCPQN